MQIGSDMVRRNPACGLKLNGSSEQEAGTIPTLSPQR